MQQNCSTWSRVNIDTGHLYSSAVKIIQSDIIMMLWLRFHQSASLWSWSSSATQSYSLSVQSVIVLVIFSNRVILLHRSATFKLCSNELDCSLLYLLQWNALTKIGLDLFSRLLWHKEHSCSCTCNLKHSCTYTLKHVNFEWRYLNVGATSSQLRRLEVQYQQIWSSVQSMTTFL